MRSACVLAGAREMQRHGGMEGAAFTRSNHDAPNGLVLS